MQQYEIEYAIHGDNGTKQHQTEKEVAGSAAMAVLQLQQRHCGRRITIGTVIPVNTTNIPQYCPHCGKKIN